MDLKKKVKSLPESSGVYIMLGSNEEILYVGKAKNLRNRVRHYFLESLNDLKTMTLVSKIADFKYIVVPTEVDALVLENNLIKLHKPPYNILLKDDKTYPYIKIAIKDSFPRVEVTRVLKKDGSRYFGPYMLGISPSALLELIHYAFPVRSCKKDLSKQKKCTRECLNFYIGRCLGPCTGKVSKKDYKKVIDSITAFLNGNDTEVKQRLQCLMEEASKRQDYELALQYRDGLKLLENLQRRQLLALPKDASLDIFAYVDDGFSSVVSVLNVRAGKTVGVDNFALNNVSDVGDELTQFAMQYYTKNPIVAREILLSVNSEYSSSLSDFLTEKAGHKIAVSSPSRGINKELVKVAIENGKDYLEKNASQIKRNREMTMGAVEELKLALMLKNLPLRIECYDISHLGGTHTVSSMVVFQSGQKASDMYRRFHIKTVNGPDDFKSMKETLTRRFKRIAEGTEDASFSMRPDLIVIDGGKGQLSSVADIIPSDIDVISLAKREEEVFLRTNPQTPIILPFSSSALKLLQRIRDEAHRFAITFNRNDRQKNALHSQLEDIKGVGVKRAKNLIIEFGSIKDVAVASVAELKLKGKLPEDIARNVYDFYHKD